MTAIEFIKNHPQVQEWILRGWNGCEWETITLLDVITERFGSKCYVSLVHDNGKGEVWVE